MAFDLGEYEEVKDRLPRFWAEHRHGQVITELISITETDYIVKAAVMDGTGRTIATGFAQEKVGSTPVNQTSALENCETSAIGRALANAGFGSGQHRPSREEMSKPAQDQSRGRKREGEDSPAPMTDPQRKAIYAQLDQRDITDVEIPADVEALTKAQASAFLDILKAAPLVSKATRRGPRPPATPTTPDVDPVEVAAAHADDPEVELDGTEPF